jgi:hypothetical protein
MGKVTPLKPAPGTDSAEVVAPKLADAQTKLAELEAQATAAALSAALGEMGASARLTDINSLLDVARRDTVQLQSAYVLAQQRDAMAQAEIDSRGRRSQIAEMKKHADARLEAAIQMCAALKKASLAYSEFLRLTDLMATSMPLGLLNHVVPWHQIEIEIDGRLFPARIENVVAGEMYRHADLSRRDRPSGAALPGSAAPVEHQRLNPAAIEPADKAVQRANAWLLGLIEGRIKSIEQANAAKFAKIA